MLLGLIGSAINFTERRTSGKKYIRKLCVNVDVILYYIFYIMTCVWSRKNHGMACPPWEGSKAVLRPLIRGLNDTYIHSGFGLVSISGIFCGLLSRKVKPENILTEGIFFNRINIENKLRRRVCTV